jgi:hypothetical protein
LWKTIAFYLTAYPFGSSEMPEKALIFITADKRSAIYGQKMPLNSA